MKKVFDLEDLDCANCAAKMEEGIRKIEGVEEVNVNFLTQKMTLAAPDEIFDKILKQAVRVCRKIEPDWRILVKWLGGKKEAFIGFFSRRSCFWPLLLPTSVREKGIRCGSF